MSSETSATSAPAAVTPAWPLVVSREMATVVVTVRGDLDLPASARLGAVLRDLIDDQGNLSLLMDLRRVTRVDPPGLEMLRHAAQALRRRGGRLRLRQPTVTVRDALTLSGLVGLVLSSHPAGTNL